MFNLSIRNEYHGQAGTALVKSLVKMSWLNRLFSSLGSLFVCKKNPESVTKWQGHLLLFWTAKKMSSLQYAIQMFNNAFEQNYIQNWTRTRTLLHATKVMEFCLSRKISEAEPNFVSVILRVCVFLDKVILAWKINLTLHQQVRHHWWESQIRVYSQMANGSIGAIIALLTERLYPYLIRDCSA